MKQTETLYNRRIVAAHVHNESEEAQKIRLLCELMERRAHLFPEHFEVELLRNRGCVFLQSLERCENACISCITKYVLFLLFIAACTTVHASGSSSSICHASTSQRSPFSTCSANAGPLAASKSKCTVPLGPTMLGASYVTPPETFLRTWFKWLWLKLPNWMTPPPLLRVQKGRHLPQLSC